MDSGSDEFTTRKKVLVGYTLPFLSAEKDQALALLLVRSGKETWMGMEHN